MPVQILERALSGLLVLKPTVFSDERGFFLETYKKSDFKALGIADDFVQDNQSRSSKGTLRGLHYQMGASAQAKLVRVVSGRIWDVGVDLDPRSATFRQWFGIELSVDNAFMLYLPPWFAHGFVSLEDNTDVVYKCSKEYDKSMERGVRWDDPDLGIAWPCTPSEISSKDAALPLIRDIL